MSAEFIRIVDFGTHVTVEFMSDYWAYNDGKPTNIFRLNAESLKVRIANREKPGRDTSVERTALAELKKWEGKK